MATVAKPVIVCGVCRKKHSNKKCSTCELPICSFLCFTQSNHQFICGLEKKQEEEEKESQLISFIKENQIEQVTAFLNGQKLENPSLVQFARTSEMCQLLIDRHGGDLYSYIGQGKVALDECGKYFPLLPFLKKDFGTEYDDPPLNKMLGWLTYDRPGKFYTTEKFPISTVKQLRARMSNGFFPKTKNPRKTAFFEKIYEDIFFKRYNKATIEFWTGYTIKKILKSIVSFQYLDESILVENLGISPVSFPLILFSPDLVYKGSNRPINFNKMKDIYGNYDSNYENNVPRDTEEFTFLPVTRYGTRNEGLYKHEKTIDFCGTFYFLESESMAFLKFRNLLVIEGGKCHAFDILYDQLMRMGKMQVKYKELADELRRKDNRNLYVYNVYELKEFFDWHTKNKMIFDLMFTPKEFLSLKLINRDIKTTMRSSIENKKIQMERSYYCGHVLQYYAQEDRFDQVICNMAVDLGYEGILLKHMVGSRQVVAEILDVRSRKTSFGNLTFVEEKEEEDSEN